jgi:acyl-CoA thioesterase YciA
MRNLTIKTRAYPGDLNHIGTVFGGWVMSQMDTAASIAVGDIIHATAVTVGVSDLHFIKPIRSGDVVSVYTMISKIGNSSIHVYVEVVVQCQKEGCDSRCEMPVTEGTFTFVAVSKEGEKVPVKSVLRAFLPDEIHQLLLK